MDSAGLARRTVTCRLGAFPHATVTDLVAVAVPCAGTPRVPVAFTWLLPLAVIAIDHWYALDEPETLWTLNETGTCPFACPFAPFADVSVSGSAPESVNASSA